MTYQDLPRPQRVPEHLEADAKSLAIIVALTDQALAARAAVLDAADQAHIATATWGLELWEDLVGIVPETGATDADRRKAITAKLLGAGTCNAGMISDIAKALTGCDAVVIEQFSTYQFSLQFIGDEPGLAQRFGVMSIPTVVCLKNGRETARSVGLVPLEKLTATLGL